MQPRLRASRLPGHAARPGNVVQSQTAQLLADKRQNRGRHQEAFLRSKGRGADQEISRARRSRHYLPHKASESGSCFSQREALPGFPACHELRPPKFPSLSTLSLSPADSAFISCAFLTLAVRISQDSMPSLLPPLSARHATDNRGIVASTRLCEQHAIKMSSFMYTMQNSEAFPGLGKGFHNVSATRR